MQHYFGNELLVHAQATTGKPWGDITEKQMDVKVSNAKKILNAVAPNFMSRRLLDEIDPDGDLLNWLSDIQELQNAQ